MIVLMSDLRYLSREIDLHTAQCGVGQVVSQLHLAGDPDVPV